MENGRVCFDAKGSEMRDNDVIFRHNSSVCKRSHNKTRDTDARGELQFLPRVLTEVTWKHKVLNSSRFFSVC